MTLVTLSRHAEQTGRWSAIATGFSIPISVALDNLLLLAILAGWVLGGTYHRKFALVRENPVFVCAFMLFGLLVAAAFWGHQAASDAQSHLLKYLDLAFIPVFAHFFRDHETRRYGILAFAGSLILVLFLSFLVKFGFLGRGSIIEGTTISPVVFKFRVTHNFLMAFGAFLFALLSIHARSKPEKYLWVIVALLAAVNVLLMVEGATGYLVLFALDMLLTFSQPLWRKRGALITCAFAAGLLIATTPNPLSGRVATLVSELSNWQPGVAAHESSAGYRMEFYRNTLGIIAKHPMAGVGTGGFPAAYADAVRSTNLVATRNPHNEYLHITVQAGILGLGILIALFVMQWRAAKRLPTAIEKELARGLVLAMALGCLFNSFLLDHAEGLFYAWLTGLLYAGLPTRETRVTV